MFTAPEPIFDLATVIGADVYVYGALSDRSCFGPVGVARAPLTQVKNRAAYRFWNGAGWVADVRQIKPVLCGVFGAVSVSYNPYLQRYLAIHSDLFSRKISMRLADRPEGPWSAPVEVFTGRPSANELEYDYAGREHPELAADNGRTIFISYFQPRCNSTGELWLVEVTFN